MTVHPFQRWFVRGVLALAIATPAVLWVLERGLNADRSYTLEIEFSSSIDGNLQVFYDRGGGITEGESVAVPVTAGTSPERRVLTIPSGTFSRFRIDPPGLPGRYSIAGIQVRDRDHGIVADLPLSTVALAWQLTLTSAGPPLVVDSPPGSNDPQLILTLPAPLLLHRTPRSTWSLVATCSAVSFAALAVVLILGRACAPLEPRTRHLLAVVADRAGRRQTATVMVAAAIGTLAAMYPIVFLGKSLVSPNNGPAPLLYDRAPFTPGQQDRTIESLRGTDNGAAMWAFVPYSQTQRLALSQGEVPLWNRFNAAGRPLWGQGQSQILDPLHWAILVAPDPEIGWDVKFVLHRFVFALGTGIAVLALTASWPAAAVMSFVAPFAGFFLFRLNHPAQFSFTYASWLLWAWFRLAAASSREYARAGRWLALATVLVRVASPPKEGVVMLLCCHATGAMACLIARGDRIGRLRTVGLAGVIAVLLSAPHWLIFADTLSQSLTNYDSPSARFATWPFAVVIAFGVLKTGGLLPGAHPVIAARAMTSVAMRGTWRRWMTGAVVLGTVAALAVAFGVVPERVITQLPFFANIIQIDFAFIGAALVLLCIAGGLGFAALIDTSNGGDSREMTNVMLPTAACGVAAVILLSHAGGLAELNLFVENWTLLLSAVLATLAIPVTRIAALRWPAPLPLFTAGLVALLLVAPDAVHAVTGVPRIDDIAIQPRGRTDVTLESPAVAAIRRDARGPTRVLGLREVLFSGSQALYKLEGIGGPDALELPRYEQLMNASGVQRYWLWNHIIAGPELPQLAPFLDLVNVGYVLAARGSQDLPLPESGLAPLPMTAEDLVVPSRRSTAWPRAFFVDRVSQYRGVAEFVTQLREASGPFGSIEGDDGQAKAEMERIEAAPRSDENGEAGQKATRYESATNYKLTGNRTRFRVHASGPGVAVLSEAWMAKEFVATLNGTVTPYFRVNHAFKGVRIPAAGDWTIEFRYRPALWGMSWLLAALGVIGLVFFRFAIR